MKVSWGSPKNAIAQGQSDVMAQKDTSSPLFAQKQQSAQELADIGAQKLDSIGKQAGLLQKGAGMWQGQMDALGASEEADKLAMRRKAAAALAGLQGRAAGSGVGLAAMRSSAMERGVAENQLSKDYQNRLNELAQRKLDAESAAEAGNTQYLEAQQQSAQQNAQQISDAKSRVDSVFSSTRQNATIYTDADAQKAAQRARIEVLATYPVGSAAYNSALQAIDANLAEELG